jgi:spore coat protein U-like protein
MKFRKLLCGGTVLAGLTVLGMLGMARPALATGSAMATINIGVTVEASCTLTETDASLSAYQASSTSDDQASGSLSWECNAGTTPTSISLDWGHNALAGQRIAEDTPSTDQLSYNIYQDSGDSTLWGDGTNASSVYDTTTGSGTQDFYVDVPKNQWGPSGSFQDTVTATLNY